MEQQQQLLLVLIVLGFAGFAGSAGFAGFAGSAGGAEEVCVGPADCGTKTYDDCNHPCEWVSIAEADQIAEAEEELEKYVKDKKLAFQNYKYTCLDQDNNIKDCCFAKLKMQQIELTAIRKNFNVEGTKITGNSEVVEDYTISPNMVEVCALNRAFDCDEKSVRDGSCVSHYVENGSFPPIKGKLMCDPNEPKCPPNSTASTCIPETWCKSKGYLPSHEPTHTEPPL